LSFLSKPPTAVSLLLLPNRHKRIGTKPCCRVIESGSSFYCRALSIAKQSLSGIAFQSNCCHAIPLFILTHARRIGYRKRINCCYRDFKSVPTSICAQGVYPWCATRQCSVSTSASSELLSFELLIATSTSSDSSVIAPDKVLLSPFSWHPIKFPTRDIKCKLVQWCRVVKRVESLKVTANVLNPVYSKCCHALDILIQNTKSTHARIHCYCTQSI